MASGGDLTVAVHDDLHAITPIGWDKMVAAAGAPIFYDSRYLTAYQQFPLGPIARFGYLAVTEPGADLPVAVVPLTLHLAADPFGRLRGTYPGIECEPALLSHVWHCYDTQIVGGAGRPEVAEAIVAALADLAMAWQARWYGFVNVERGSATANALTAAGLGGVPLIDRFGTDLTGLTDLGDYLKRLAVRPRANITRMVRRAADNDMTTTVCAAHECDLDEVAELCGRTAARFGNTGFYPREAFAGFVTELGPLAHILAVRQRDRLVAVGVCLTDDRRFHTWTCGVDYAVTGNASPYAVLFAESMSLAIRLGLPVFEGGRSNEVFKTRHGLAVRHLDAHVRRVQ